MSTQSRGNGWYINQSGNVVWIEDEVAEIQELLYQNEDLDDTREFFADWKM